MELWLHRLAMALMASQGQGQQEARIVPGPLEVETMDGAIEALHLQARRLSLHVTASTTSGEGHRVLLAVHPKITKAWQDDGAMKLRQLRSGQRVTVNSIMSRGRWVARDIMVKDRALAPGEMESPFAPVGALVSCSDKMPPSVETMEAVCVSS